MPFPVATTEERVPTKVQALVITSQYSWEADPDDPEAPETLAKSGKFAVYIHDQDGAEMTVLRGNLIPHLSPAEIANQIAFMDAQWAKALAVIPPA